MKYKKVKPVTSPNRGTPLSAGIDFYIPEISNDFVKDFLDKNKHLSLDLESGIFRLGPHESALIPSGIKVELPPGHALIAFNKSSVATKFKMDIMACVIDEDYQGEVHLSVVNTSDHHMDLYTGQKLVQFILLPVNYSDPIEDEDIHQVETERKGGGFGSTNL